MKMKYLKITTDNGRGVVKHIILQVEETDTFIIQGGIDPGYKIIIDCTKHRVAAAGGHNFNPFYNESARDVSCKLTSNESDLLGVYLSYCNDIDDMPDQIDVDKFWDIIYASSHNKNTYNINRKIEKLYDEGILKEERKYYKVLYKNQEKYNSYQEYAEELKNALNEVIQSEESSSELKEALPAVLKDVKWIENQEGKPETHYTYAIVDAENLEQLEAFYSIPSDYTLADYVWCRFEILPISLWNEFANKNDIFSYEQC